MGLGQPLRHAERPQLAPAGARRRRRSSYRRECCELWRVTVALEADNMRQMRSISGSSQFLVAGSDAGGAAHSVQYSVAVAAPHDDAAAHLRQRLRLRVDTV